MFGRHRNRPAAAALAAVLLAGPACAGVLDEVGGGGGHGGTTMYGEIRSIDTRRGQLQLREENGRDQNVRYDNRTQVVYRSQVYHASSLERGDRVRVRVTYDRNNTRWADRIDVRESARDRGRLSNRVERVDGVVRAVDTRRGYFTLERTRAGTVTVYMARNARREDIRRFERLRRGERVRADVQATQRNTAQLVRFR